MTTHQVNITLGTAGHIDHGKTLLTKMLTGCETDTLKEEKERGMSIELGFAPCLIADLEVGIVDVPGHENFIKTMVAGATGIDGVILVVAADDGIMPQTREHLDILTLLGIRHGLVAMTKIDRADAPRREQVHDDLVRLLRGTFLESAPILGISNITGEGFSDFLDALAALVHSIQPKRTDGVFRLPIERTFSVKGFGTVVTGIPVAGALRMGDEVVLLPQGLEGRVAGLQVYGRDSDSALAGQCIAMQLRRWDHHDIERGQTVTLPGFFEPQMWYACQLRLLAHGGLYLENATHVKFHTGTSEVTATAYLMDGEKAEAGEERLVQIRADAPLVAGPGDRFILRTISPPRTIGGGMIIEALPGRLKRTRAGIMEDLAARAKAVASPRDFVAYAVRSCETYIASADYVARRAKVPRSLLQGLLDELVKEGHVTRPGPDLYLHEEALQRLQTAAQEALAAFHRSAPQSPGLTTDQLAESLGLEKDRLKILLELAKKSGAVVEKNGRLAHPEHRESFSPQDQKFIDAIESAFRGQPFSPPSPDQAASAAGASRDQAARIYRILFEHGRLVKVEEDLYFHREAVDRARQLLEDHIRKEDGLESVKFKYVLDTTRKFAIPLLDYFDRLGVTVRSGYTRLLRGGNKPGDK